MQQRCPNCGSPIVPGQRFCGGCGAQLSLACPQCRITVSPGTRFCPNCGATLGGGMPQQPGWGQQAGGMPPQQPGWGQQPGTPQQPGWGQQQTWAPPAQQGQPSSSNRPLLILVLFILLIGLGTLTYLYTPIGATIKDLLQSATGGTTTPTVDTTEPEFSQVLATPGPTSARIDWETDELASTQVEYGKTQENTSLEPDTPGDDPTSGTSAGVLVHYVILTSLESDTTYYYRLISKDAAGNEAVSDWKTFNTTVPEA
ncbi:MAG: zinc ribbon domain-containing protein [Chloroflexota bacterium]|nr:MAG: zinc ribbon domain-containing protein [Chloroflexota bacterium]